MYSFRVLSLSLLCFMGMLTTGSRALAQELKATLMLKTPGNMAIAHELKQQGSQLVSNQAMPLDITLKQADNGGDELITVNIKAKERAYFNLGFALSTGLSSNQSEFYMPGLWYHRNLRSPLEAPNYKVSKSWNFREDRLSTPLTSAFNAQLKTGVAVLHVVPAKGTDVQMQNTEGQIILPWGIWDLTTTLPKPG